MIREFLFTLAVVLGGFLLLLAYAVAQRPAGPWRRVAWVAAGGIAVAVWSAGYRDWPGWAAAVPLAVALDVALPWPPPFVRRRPRRRG